MEFDTKKYSAEQIAWCKEYEKETGFEPLMCDFEAGNETFYEAARKSVGWFEDWAIDALLRITRTAPPGAPDECGACGDGCETRGLCRLADESPKPEVDQ